MIAFSNWLVARHNDLWNNRADVPEALCHQRVDTGVQADREMPTRVRNRQRIKLFAPRQGDSN